MQITTELANNEMFDKYRYDFRLQVVLTTILLWISYLDLVSAAPQDSKLIPLDLSSLYS